MTPPPNHFRFRLLVGLVALNLLVIAMALLWLKHDRKQDEDTARVSTQNLALALEDNLSTTFFHIENALNEIADEYQRLDAAGRIQPGKLNTMLALRKKHLPELDGLYIVDAQGIIRHGNTSVSFGISVADREHFIAARSNPNAKLLISKPMYGRVNQNWIIVLAHRVNRRDGSFAGMISASLPVEYVARTFARLDVGPHGVVSLRDDQLDLIARKPEFAGSDGSIGSQIVSPELRELVQFGKTNAIDTASVTTDHLSRMIAYRKAGHYPFYIFVALAKEDYLAHWRQEVFRVSAQTTLFLLLTLFGGRLVDRDRLRLKTANAELIRQEEKFHDIARASADWIWEINKDGRYTYVSHSVTKLLGYSPEEAVGRTPFDFMPGDEAQRVKNLFSDLSVKARPFRDLEIINMHKDGALHTVLSTGSPFFDEKGNLLGYRGVDRDITQHKRNQAELEKYRCSLEQQVAERSAQLHTILENIPGAIYRCALDKYWTVEYISREIEQISGYPASDFLHNSVRSYASIIHLDDVAMVERSVHEGVAAKQPYELEYRIQNAHDETRWIWERGRAHFDEHGNIRYLDGIFFDITRRKAAESELQQLRESLELRVADEVAKNVAKEHLLIRQSRQAAMGEMIGNIAHQWRQPLNLLGLIVQNVQDEYKRDLLNGKALDDYVASAMRTIQQMSKTIDDFRYFFKPSSSPEKFNVHEAIEECLELIAAGLKYNNIETNLSGDIQATLLGYKSEFVQVMLNLVSNAKEALQDNKVNDGKISIAILRQDEGLCVRVTDNAGGIAGKNLDKIFDPYFTTKDKGSGIGLYMSRMIVEQHMHGRIGVRNTADGAEFTVTLPQTITAESL